MGARPDTAVRSERLRVLVTGHDGYIGRVLTRVLRATIPSLITAR